LTPTPSSARFALLIMVSLLCHLFWGFRFPLLSTAFEFEAAGDGSSTPAGFVEGWVPYISRFSFPRAFVSEVIDFMKISGFFSFEVLSRFSFPSISVRLVSFGSGIWPSLDPPARFRWVPPSSSVFPPFSPLHGVFFFFSQQAHPPPLSFDSAPPQTYRVFYSARAFFGNCASRFV